MGQLRYSCRCRASGTNRVAQPAWQCRKRFELIYLVWRPLSLSPSVDKFRRCMDTIVSIFICLKESPWLVRLPGQPCGAALPLAAVFSTFLMPLRGALWEVGLGDVARVLRVLIGQAMHYFVFPSPQLLSSELRPKGLVSANQVLGDRSLSVRLVTAISISWLTKVRYSIRGPSGRLALGWMLDVYLTIVMRMAAKPNSVAGLALAGP
jgi:hypothetical protein